jgi:hypothetical protein
LEKTVLLPQESLELQLIFYADGFGYSEALLVIPSNDPDESTLEVYLKASAQENAIWFEPGTVDFGSLLMECDAQTQVELYNGGAEAVSVDALTLSGDMAFELTHLELPYLLTPGSSLPISVVFSKEKEGASVTTLIAEQEGVRLAEGGLIGTRLTSAHIEESFDINGGKLDLVIPVQANGTQTDTGPLVEGFPAFLDILDALDVDYQIAVVQESDGCVYGSSPFFSSSQDREEQMEILEGQLDGTSLAHGLVVSMEAVKEDRTGPGGCNEGLVRKDAHLAIMGYTYVGGNHPDMGWYSAVNSVVNVKGDIEDVTYFGIIEDLPSCGWGSHSFWSEAINMTGGT